MRQPYRTRPSPCAGCADAVPLPQAGEGEKESSLTRTLVIDTATAACSVALVEDGRTLAAEHEEVGRGHAERLLPLIAALPDGGRADHILVDVGPGSFTGIRVGIAAARGLALGWEATIAGYSSLAAVAIGRAIDIQGGEPFAVMIEGGHGEVFMQSFAPESGLIALDQMVSVKPDEALARLGARTAIGSGVGRLTTLPPARNGGSTMPRADMVSLLPQAFRTLPPAPLYGRAPDAKLPSGTVTR